MLIGILLSIFGTFLSLSAFITWVFLVTGSLCLCGWLKTKLPSRSLVLYFVVSVLGSLSFLVSCCGLPCSGILLQLSILLKLGIAPFHFWILPVLSHLDLLSLCFFLGPTKVGLLFLLLRSSLPSPILYLLSTFLGLILLYLSRHIYLVVYASGSLQLIILYFLTTSIIIVYWCIYMLALVSVALSPGSHFSPLMAFLGLAGLPPFTMFWAKLLVLCSLPSFLSFFVLVLSCLSVWPYVRLSLSMPSHSLTSPLLLILSILFPFALVIFFVL